MSSDSGTLATTHGFLLNTLETLFGLSTLWSAEAPDGYVIKFLQ